MSQFLQKLHRTKLPESVTSETSLKRCLSVVDLTVIGIGSMIGSGIYIMTGITAREQSGPSIVLSFLVASLIVVVVAACFTELAARLHKTGSTYLYLYLTVGELPAFIVGFGILILTVFSAATNARAWSAYVDFIFHQQISNWTETYLTQWNIGAPIASYPDILAVVISVILTVVVALGVQCSARISAIFVVTNISVLMFVSVCGIVYGDLSNWWVTGCSDVSTNVSVTVIDIVSNITDNIVTSTANCSNNDINVGGFMPFGWTGVVQGAATCFWAFSGFEMISCAVEESRNPSRDIPLATAVTMSLVTLLYLGASAGLTLLVPYTSIDVNAPLPSAFDIHGLYVGHYIVAIGPLCGFTTAIISNIYGFVRIALAMSEDGLLVSWFSRVNMCSHVPVWSVLFCGTLQSLIAFVFDIRGLIEFNVNLLVISYTAVCVCVIVLRYTAQDSSVGVHSELSRTQDTEKLHDEQAYKNDETLLTEPLLKKQEINSLELPDILELEQYKTKDSAEHVKLRVCDESLVDSETFCQLSVSDIDVSRDVIASSSHLLSICQCIEPLVICRPRRCVMMALLLMLVCMLGLSFTLIYCLTPLEAGTWWSLLIVIVTALGTVLFLGFICAHRQTLENAALKLPCVPLIPSVAALLCLILLVSNSTRVGWIGSAVVLFTAVVNYFLYGIHNSKLNRTTRDIYLNTALHSDSVTQHLLDEPSDEERSETDELNNTTL